MFLLPLKVLFQVQLHAKSRTYDSPKTNTYVVWQIHHYPIHVATIICCLISGNMHLLAHPHAYNSNKPTSLEEFDVLIGINVMYSCILSSNCHKFVSFSHKTSKFFSYLTKNSVIWIFLCWPSWRWSWQYHCQTVCESSEEIFMTYFILDPLDLYGKVLNGLHEKLDEALVVLEISIYRQ